MNSPKPLKVLQVNLNRSRTAMDLLAVDLAREGGVALISEPNKKIAANRNYLTDKEGDAAIAFSKTLMPTGPVGSDRGFVWAMVHKITFYSCYISPNTDIDNFKRFLDHLGNSVRGAVGEVIVAGDFNAACTDWGSTVTSARGHMVREWWQSLGLAILNDGEEPTWVRGE